MGKIVIELTNRCNLHCQHCFAGRHGGHDDLPLAIFAKILDEAKTLGFGHFGFTGGEPTVHQRFFDILEQTCTAGYRFGWTTNGWNFTTIYSHLLPYRAALDVITFSLDGASEAIHDRLRGKGSYRRVLQAMSICVVEDIPFTINMVVTAHNRHELKPMAQLAARLGSRGLRFGHLMPTPLTTAQGFDLSPLERKLVEAEIWQLRRSTPIPIALAPGHHTTDLFPCAPLHLQEVNVDCHGNLTKCCHLSGHGDGAGQGDIIGNLGEMSFREAYQRLAQENTKFHQEKHQRLTVGTWQDTDFFPCWYCACHYQKVAWLKSVEGHAWSDFIV